MLFSIINMEELEIIVLENDITYLIQSIQSTKYLSHYFNLKSYVFNQKCAREKPSEFSTYKFWMNSPFAYQYIKVDLLKCLQKIIAEKIILDNLCKNTKAIAQGLNIYGITFPSGLCLSVERKNSSLLLVVTIREPVETGCLTVVPLFWNNFLPDSSWFPILLVFHKPFKTWLFQQTWELDHLISPEQNS